MNKIHSLGVELSLLLSSSADLEEIKEENKVSLLLAFLKDSMKDKQANNR